MIFGGHTCGLYDSPNKQMSSTLKHKYNTFEWSERVSKPLAQGIKKNQNVGRYVNKFEVYLGEGLSVEAVGRQHKYLLILDVSLTAEVLGWGNAKLQHGSTVLY